MHRRGNILVFAAPTAVALWFVAGYAMPYFANEPHQFGIYWPRHQWLYAHVIAGTAALLLGPAQLWLGLNASTRILHRILGVLYVVAVSVGGVAAFYLAAHNDFGWVYGTGLASMAFVWMVSTILATIAICLHRAEQHREWMIRSYVVTFGFVTFRVVDSILDTAKVGTLVERLTAASWLAWTLPLLIAEAIMQGRKIFQPSVGSAMKRDEPHPTLDRLPEDQPVVPQS